MVYDFIHKENAYDLATGTTNDNKIDILKGKYKYNSIDCIDDDVALKVEYKELETYFYCYKGKMLNVTENTQIKDEWKAKKKKVRKVTGEHRVIIEWENITSDDKYAWEKIENRENNIILTDKQKEGIRNKLIYMNNKYKKEVLI